MTCGFGSNFFGNQASFIVEAIAEQMQRGYEIGPQSAIAGDVAQLFCELTKMERAAFCTTGSEAVLGAMRVARTVTGRNTIVMFTGDYHGIVDEVIVRGTKKLKSLPAAPGIPTSAVENVLQRFSQLLGTGGVGATPPRRGFTPAPRIQTARKVL